MSNMVGLSKSRYCKGIQCSKILWMDKNKPELAVDTASEQVLANGDKVGELAREYFGEYSLVEYSADKAAMCKQTEELMKAGVENIAEASFIYNGLYCAVDILHKNGDGWDIVEVKSSTSVHDNYVEDMTFQYYVLKNAGVNIKGVFNMHINNQLHLPRKARY